MAENFPKDFKEQYFVICETEECFGCDSRFKSMPGFQQKSKGASLAFYSDRDSVLLLYLLAVLCQDVYGILMTENPR